MRATAIRQLDRLGAGAVLLCPLFLLHGRGVAEALVDLVAVSFLVRSALASDWNWIRTAWVPVASFWWGWLVLCSVPLGPFGAGGWPALLQAVATVRFLLFVAALQHRALSQPGPLRLMRWLIVGACCYIAAQLLLQDVTGHNLFGQGRFGDGTLTGPYDKPRAAAPLSRLLLPTVLAASAWASARAAVVRNAGTRWPLRGPLRGLLRVASLLPLLLGIATVVLAGQRMPLLLCLLGLLVSGLLLRRLRGTVLAALLAAPVLVAVSAVVSPHSFGHLVTLFERQMRHFGQSPYGLIYTRALSIGLSNPLTGLGFDGFRHGCALPGYFRDWPPWGPPAGTGGGAGICVQHAHNHYLQALTDSGMPGLLLFCAMVGSWLVALAPGRAGGTGTVLQAWRVGLFASVFIHEWPIASASAFTNMPLGGWFFLLLGVGLAEIRASRQPPGLPGSVSHMQPDQQERDRWRLTR